jgi:outer membrane protein with beta-barrel domain
MRPLRRCTLLSAALLLPGLLSAQQRGIEIGLDGGLQYSTDADLLTISVPFQRVRAAFPSGVRLAVEPGLSFTRLSSNGESLTLLVFQVGALYDFPDTQNTYVRPFAGFEYADGSFSDSNTAFNLGAGVGTRSHIADRLALRIEANLTGRFGSGGGADALIGATVGLSFFTR